MELTYLLPGLLVHTSLQSSMVQMETYCKDCLDQAPGVLKQWEKSSHRRNIYDNL
jgi:hypothetical protein